MDELLNIAPSAIPLRPTTMKRLLCDPSTNHDDHVALAKDRPRGLEEEKATWS